jgi:hypothetical protein
VYVSAVNTMLAALDVCQPGKDGERKSDLDRLCCQDAVKDFAVGTVSRRQQEPGWRRSDLLPALARQQSRGVAGLLPDLA